MRKFFLSFILIASISVSAEAATEEPLKDISLSYTFVLNSPDSQFSTLNLWAQRWMITLDGKEFLPYDGYDEDHNTVDAMVLLRKDGMKYFCYDSNTSTEHLLFDFNLQKGSTYTDDYNNIVYDVIDVRDSIIGDESLRLIELVNQNGKHDIWLEGIGSIYTGIMRGAYVSPGDVYLIRAGGNRFYPTNQYVKTADISVTKLHWNGSLDTEEDRMKYEAWYSAPSDLNAEFIDDTLHVWGRLHISRDILPYSICGMKDNQITFKVHSNGEIDSYGNYDIEARIPGFRKDNYEVILYNKTIQLECAGAETSYQPLPFLEGNPIWVYKYEHISMPRDPNLKCWVDTGNRNFTYYFLGGQKEIDGKVYTMMGEIISKGENNITFRCWLPVREENGVVYTLTDSLLYVCEHEHTPRSRDELPYLQQGDECVLYNFCAEIGEKLSPKDGNSAVESIDTYQLMDGTVCRVLKTIQGYQLCEKLGYLNFNLPLGIMAPYLSMVVPTNGHVYVDRLNAFYQDEEMLYKAPDAQEGLCVNDTCWTREDAAAYARSYKADPRQEEVFSYIRQLQMATGIIEIKNEKIKVSNEGGIYDLSGCKLPGKPARGIYIEDGKKVVIK